MRFCVVASLVIYSLVSVIIVSLISLIGIITFFIKSNKLEKWLLFLVSFAAGALLGDAFLHLLPEAAASGFNFAVSINTIVGIICFFLIEQVLHWRHCHIPTSKHHPHPFAFMNLIGDGFHNFIDGMIVAGSYLVLHEIPQELGDFGVLLFAGLHKRRALFFNFLTALTSLLGAIFTLFIGSRIPNFTAFLIPFTAGGFIYIAGVDLLPELHKRCEALPNLLRYFLALILGVLIMVLFVFLE